MTIYTGTSGDDTIMAPTGQRIELDIIYGLDGNDILGSGDQTGAYIYGGEGNDKISSSYGSFLDGGPGDDYLSGGYYSDTFIWDGASNDVIRNFNWGTPNRTDFIDLSAYYTNLKRA